MLVDAKKLGLRLVMRVPTRVWDAVACEALEELRAAVRENDATRDDIDDMIAAVIECLTARSAEQREEGS